MPNYAAKVRFSEKKRTFFWLSEIIFILLHSVLKTDLCLSGKKVFILLKFDHFIGQK